MRWIKVEATPGFRADALVVLYGNVPVAASGVIDPRFELLRRDRLRFGPQLLPGRQMASGLDGATCAATACCHCSPAAFIAGRI